MELDYAILADGVAQRPDGKLDIFGAGVDNINAPQLPALHPMITLAARFLMSRPEAEHEHTVEVILMDADGTRLAAANANVAIASDRLAEVPVGRPIGVGLVLHLANLVFSAYGAYHLTIMWDGNEARTPLRLTVVEVTPSP